MVYIDHQIIKSMSSTDAPDVIRNAFGRITYNAFTKLHPPCKTIKIITVGGGGRRPVLVRPDIVKRIALRPRPVSGSVRNGHMVWWWYWPYSGGGAGDCRYTNPVIKIK
jgi:hypothetical protein